MGEKLRFQLANGIEALCSIARLFKTVLSGAILKHHLGIDKCRFGQINLLNLVCECSLSARSLR